MLAPFYNMAMSLDKWLVSLRVAEKGPPFID